MLLTGAAGRLGRWLRPRLVAKYGKLRITDIVDPGPVAVDEEFTIADLADAALVDPLVAGAGPIIHLGAVTTEVDFPTIVAGNILGTYNLFEAVRRHNAGPIVFASSNHATGFYERGQRLDSNTPPRPDSLYGVSKACGEALASFYADKYGMEIACIRIGSALAEPEEPRHLATWFSLEDLLRMIEACLAAPALGCTILYGVSDNRRAWWSNEAAAHVPYAPQDNAEDYRDRIASVYQRDPEAPEVRFQGGSFAANDYQNRKYQPAKRGSSTPRTPA